MTKRLVGAKHEFNRLGEVAGKVKIREVLMNVSRLSCILSGGESLEGERG